MKYILSEYVPSNDFKFDGLGYDNRNIFIFGRSIGTGPACINAQKYNPRGLILVSAYTTISHVAQNIAGNFLGWFVNNHFSNIEAAKKIECPTILIHGQADELIPCEHSVKLWEELTKRNQNLHKDYSQLLLHKHMTHNDFNM